MALIIQSKDTEWLNDDIKPSMCCLLEICSSFKDIYHLRENLSKSIPSKYNRKQPGIMILITQKANWYTITNQEGHFIPT